VLVPGLKPQRAVPNDQFQTPGDILLVVDSINGGDLQVEKLITGIPDHLTIAVIAFTDVSVQINQEEAVYGYGDDGVEIFRSYGTAAIGVHGSILLCKTQNRHTGKTAAPGCKGTIIVDRCISQEEIYCLRKSVTT
jgi:hypothetical protein